MRAPAMVAHTRSTDYNNIVRCLIASAGSHMAAARRTFFQGRSGCQARGQPKYISKFEEAGYAFVDTATQLAAAAAKPETTKLLGLFNDKNVDGALDRKFLKRGTVDKFPDQPDLTDEMRAALEVLARGDKGFVLMVEGVDKYSPSLVGAAVYEPSCRQRGEDRQGLRGQKQRHAAHRRARPCAPVSIIGTYDDSKASNCDRLQRTRSAISNFRHPCRWLPGKVDVSRSCPWCSCYPDYCDPGSPTCRGEVRRRHRG